MYEDDELYEDEYDRCGDLGRCDLCGMCYEDNFPCVECGWGFWDDFEDEDEAIPEHGHDVVYHTPWDLHPDLRAQYEQFFSDLMDGNLTDED